MQSFTTILVAALSASAVSASPLKVVDTRQTALTSCPSNAPAWIGESSTTSPLWDNVCCEYQLEVGTCCLLDVSKGGVPGADWITEACSTFQGSA